MFSFNKITLNKTSSLRQSIFPSGVNHTSFTNNLGFRFTLIRHCSSDTSNNSCLSTLASTVKVTNHQVTDSSFMCKHYFVTVFKGYSNLSVQRRKPGFNFPLELWVSFATMISPFRNALSSFAMSREGKEVRIPNMVHFYFTSFCEFYSPKFSKRYVTEDCDIMLHLLKCFVKCYWVIDSLNTSKPSEMYSS